jgi:hypothetical protein
VAVADEQDARLARFEFERLVAYDAPLDVADFVVDTAIVGD